MLRRYGLDLEVVENKFRELKDDVTLVFFTQETHCAHCNEARKIFEHLADMTHKISFEVYNFAIVTVVNDKGSFYGALDDEEYVDQVLKMA